MALWQREDKIGSCLKSFRIFHFVVEVLHEVYASRFPPPRLEGSVHTIPTPMSCVAIAVLVTLGCFPHEVPGSQKLCRVHHYIFSILNNPGTSKCSN